MVSILVIAIFLAISINKKNVTRDVGAHCCMYYTSTIISSAINILQRILIALFVNFRNCTSSVFAILVRRYHHHHHRHLRASNALIYNFPMECVRCCHRHLSLLHCSSMFGTLQSYMASKIIQIMTIIHSTLFLFGVLENAIG